MSAADNGRRAELLRLYLQLSDAERLAVDHVVRLFQVRKAAPGPEVEAEIKAIVKAGRKGRCAAVPSLH